MKHLPEAGRAREDCRVLGLALADEVYDRLTDFASLLAEESTGTNLIGPSELPRLWERHVLESMAYTIFLRKDLKTVDVGSGAGFPGVVLAIMGFEMELLEPRRKRYSFLLRAVEDLCLKNVDVVRKKLLSCPVFPRGTQFVARTVMKPARLLDQLKTACSGSFSCTRRYGISESPPAGAETVELPSPPLDRLSILVQYRHPD